MNAGAYGGEMKDVLTEVTVLTPEGTFLTLPVAELDLSYRHSIIRNVDIWWYLLFWSCIRAKQKKFVRSWKI